MSAAIELAADRKVDALQKAWTDLPQVDCPVIHTHTPGLYTRCTTMPAGSYVISKIHKTEHPFVILKGTVSVWTENEGVRTYQAPHFGVTKPGTRRLLKMHTESTWMTFHPTSQTDLASIESELILKRDIPEFSSDELQALESEMSKITLPLLAVGGVS